MSFLEPSGLGAHQHTKHELSAIKKASPSSVQELEALVEILARGKYQWESTFDAIQDPVVIVGRDYSVLRINRAGETSSGIPIRELIGTRCYQSLAGRDGPCPGCPLLEVHTSKRTQTARLEPFLRTGRSYSVSAYPLVGKEGPSDQVVLHYRDITDEQELQKRLIHSDKMAAVGTLAGGVAHEINNPLAGILAFAQLAIKRLQKTDPDSPIREDLQEIETAAIRCKEIVEDLLDFARTPISDEMSSVDINQAIRHLIPLVNVKMAKNPTRIETLLDSTVPPVCGKSNKLQQVLLNLMTNALDAMRHQGGLLTIRTRLSTVPLFDKPVVCVEVEDQGEGIPKEHLHKIFEPFFTTKTQGEGTGLGLSISYGIVKECGGHIDLESEVGRGTTAKLYLPVFGESTALVPE